MGGERHSRGFAGEKSFPAEEGVDVGGVALQKRRSWGGCRRWRCWKREKSWKASEKE